MTELQWWALNRAHEMAVDIRTASAEVREDFRGEVCEELLGEVRTRIDLILECSSRLEDLLFIIRADANNG